MTTPALPVSNGLFSTCSVVSTLAPNQQPSQQQLPRTLDLAKLLQTVQNKNHQNKNQHHKRPLPPFGGTSLTLSKTAKKPRIKKTKTVVSVDWKNKLSTCQQILVGVDMSLTNPGLCLLNPHLHMIHLFAFRNRVKEKSMTQMIVKCPNSVFDGWLFKTTLIEEWPEQAFPFSLERISRYETRIQSLMGILGENHQNHMVVGIEHYAFAAGQSRGDSTLKELGGILRRQLCMMKHKIVEIVPSQVKRIFCQKGDAKKKDMYKAYRDLYHLPDLFTLLNIKRSTEKKDEIPHPIEDMVDALAVAMSVLVKQ